MDLGTLKITDCVLKPCVVRADAPLFGEEPGFHNKMEMISRRAYGFRNFENYRLRVKALCC